MTASGHACGGARRLLPPREMHVRDLTLVVLGGRAERDDELHEAEAPEDEQLA